MSITIIDRLNRLAWLIYGLFYHLVQFTRHVDTLQTSIMTQMRRWHILSMILMRKLLSLIVNDLAFDNVRLDERLRVLLFSRWSRVTTMMVSYVHSHRVPFMVNALKHSQYYDDCWCHTGVKKFESSLPRSFFYLVISLITYFYPLTFYISKIIEFLWEYRKNDILLILDGNSRPLVKVALETISGCH